MVVVTTSERISFVVFSYLPLFVSLSCEVCELQSYYYTSFTFRFRLIYLVLLNGVVRLRNSVYRQGQPKMGTLGFGEEANIP